MDIARKLYIESARRRLSFRGGYVIKARSSGGKGEEWVGPHLHLPEIPPKSKLVLDNAALEKYDLWHIRAKALQGMVLVVELSSRELPANISEKLKEDDLFLDKVENEDAVYCSYDTRWRKQKGGLGHQETSRDLCLAHFLSPKLKLTKDPAFRSLEASSYRGSYDLTLVITEQQFEQLKKLEKNQVFRVNFRLKE